MISATDTNFFALHSSIWFCMPDDGMIKSKAQLAFLDVDKNGDGFAARDELLACMATAKEEVAAKG